MRSLDEATLSDDERAVLDRFVSRMEADHSDLDEVAWSFSIHVHDEPWLRRRRDVGAPFVRELERDHIELVASS